MYQKSVLRFAVVLFAAILVVNCSGGQRPEESLHTRALVPMEALDLSAAPKFGPDAGSYSAIKGRHRHHVLALSSGGAEGAYGAGVLVGWSESGKRPNFDVVSGVSTGALLAVMVFLGPSQDKAMEDYFTSVTKEDIFEDRGIMGLFSDSLYDNKPLEKRIQKIVTPRFLKRVAAEHKKGRRLYVGTTNIDSGELVVWDMGDIAMGGRTNDVLHFQKVLRASAAIPGLFPPVYIKPKRGVQLRQAHVDGGIKAPVLIGDYMFPPKVRKKSLYVVINGSMKRLNSARAVKASVLDIARKSIAEAMRELTDDTVYRGYVMSRGAGAKFYITAIPDSLTGEDKSLAFDPKRNRQLFEAGRAAGRKGVSTWGKEPPRLNPYERVAIR